MSANAIGMIVVGCLFIGCIGMVLWTNRPLVRDWFEHHHWHWPRFH